MPASAFINSLTVALHTRTPGKASPQEMVRLLYRTMPGEQPGPLGNTTTGLNGVGFDQDGWPVDPIDRLLTETDGRERLQNFLKWAYARASQRFEAARRNPETAEAVEEVASGRAVLRNQDIVEVQLLLAIQTFIGEHYPMILYQQPVTSGKEKTRDRSGGKTSEPGSE